MRYLSSNTVQIPAHRQHPQVRRSSRPGNDNADITDVAAMTYVLPFRRSGHVHLRPPQARTVDATPCSRQLCGLYDSLSSGFSTAYGYVRNFHTGSFSFGSPVIAHRASQEKLIPHISSVYSSNKGHIGPPRRPLYNNQAHCRSNPPSRSRRPLGNAARRPPRNRQIARSPGNRVVSAEAY